MSAFWNKNGKWFGLGFTLLVVGLLVYLHVFGKVVVPQLFTNTAKVPDILVCDTAKLDWINQGLVAKVKANWEPYGYQLGVLKRVPCGSLNGGKLCEYKDNLGKPRPAPCESGHIVIDQVDAWAQEDHAGQTFFLVDGAGKLLFGTILEPVKITGADEVNAPMLPPDAEEIVLVHEVGHWFGLGHAETRIAGPFIAIPTGHAMHPNLIEGGLDLDGVPMRVSP